MMAFQSNFVTFSGNVVSTVFSSSDTHGDGVGIDIDLQCTNCTITHNFIYNCQGAGMYTLSSGTGGVHRMSNNILVNCLNLSTSTDLGAIVVWGDDPTLVYNNTVIGGGPSFSVNPINGFPDVGSTAKVLNNCFCAPAGVPTVLLNVTLASTAGMVMDGNYHQSGDGLFLANIQGTTYTSLAAWQAATGFETNGIAAGHCHFEQPLPIPALTPSTLAGASVYAPIPGSPLLGAGINLLGTYGITPLPDFLGNLWTQNSIGAIYNPSSPNAYAAAVYADNPLAFWRLAEPSAITYGTGTLSQFQDSISTFQPGTWTAATLGQAAIVLGDGGDSVSFNGSTTIGLLAAPLPHAYSLSAFTIEFTFKPASVSIANQTIIASENFANAREDFIVLLQGSTTLAFAVRDTGSGNVTGSVSSTFVANTTYTVQLSWTGTTWTAYVNGVSKTVSYSTQVALSSMTISEIRIGNEFGQSRLAEGLLSDIALYPAVLSGTRAAAHYAAASTVNYVLTGPTSGSVGVASSNFVLTPTSAVTDSGTIASSHGGDTLSHTTFSFSSSATPLDITLTAATLGARTITFTSTGGLAIAGSPATYTATVPFVVTGPATVQAGVASTFTFTPGASTTDTVTPNDGGAGGTFSPATLSFSSSSAATSAYTAAFAAFGPIVISGTSVDGALFTPADTTAYNAQAITYLSKWGKGLYQVVKSTATGGNSNLVQGVLSGVNTAVTWKVNGSVIATDPPVLIGGQSFLAYRPQCGGVDSIAMVTGGANYVTPQFTATALHGCSGLVLANSGVGTIASGIPSYTITAAGSGYTTSFAVPIPGGSFSQQAWAWVNVVSGSVTSVVPLTGSQLAYGIGYTGSSFSATLNGSQAFISTGSWVLASSLSPPVVIPGSGLVVTANIGHYVVPPAITSPGTGATGQVVFTITDTGGSGTGATCVSVMSGPAPTDTITYSMPVNALGVTINSDFAAIPPAVNATATNSRGSLEPGFDATPTMGAGINLGLTPSYYANNVYLSTKNKLKGANPWTLAFNATLGTKDANFYPAFWTPNSWIQANFYSFVNQQNGASCAQYTGTWALQYDDDFYTTPALGHPSYAAITIIQGSAATLTPVDAAYTFTRPTCTATVSGGAVTSIAVNTGGSGLQGVLLTLTGGAGSNAAFVGVVTAGVLTSCVQVCGGSGYSGAPTVTVTPTTVSGSVVTALFNAQFTALNTGGNLNLWMTLVSGSDGTQHVHNPWIFAPTTRSIAASPTRPTIT